MCIIIDANTAHELREPTTAAKPVLARLANGTLRLVSADPIKAELFRAGMKTLYRQLVLAGRVVEFRAVDVNQEATVVNQLGPRSNDVHIIALARVSGARILFSRDRLLHSDFCNPNIIRNPRGKVYQSRSHQHILDEVECACA